MINNENYRTMLSDSILGLWVLFLLAFSYFEVTGDIYDWRDVVIVVCNL